MFKALWQIVSGKRLKYNNAVWPVFKPIYTKVLTEIDPPYCFVLRNLVLYAGESMERDFRDGVFSYTINNLDAELVKRILGTYLGYFLGIFNHTGFAKRIEADFPEEFQWDRLITITGKLLPASKEVYRKDLKAEKEGADCNWSIYLHLKELAGEGKGTEILSLPIHTMVDLRPKFAGIQVMLDMYKDTRESRMEEPEGG